MASKELDEKLDIQLVSGRILNTPQQVVRFHINQEMGQTTIGSILNKSLKNKSIEAAKIFFDGGTTFELTCNDTPLSEISAITELPFGQIAKYSAYPDRELFTLFSPTFDDINGKTRLLNIEKKLEQYGSANLIEFRKMKRRDYAIIDYIDRHGEFPEVWLHQEELNILNTAIDYGYFESPRRIVLDDLARKLEIKKAVLSDKLRQINRHVLDRFIKQMNQPFSP